MMKHLSFFSGNHVTKKHNFVDSIFRGFAKICLCCLKGVNIKSSNKNVKISKYRNTRCCLWKENFIASWILYSLVLVEPSS